MLGVVEVVGYYENRCKGWGLGQKGYPLKIERINEDRKIEREVKF